MNPETNKTLHSLENLEHEIYYMIHTTMYHILDNGDKPDKRIDAIVGLHHVAIAVQNKLSKVTESITESK